MGRIEWASAARILGWVIGLSLLVGTVLRMVLQFELVGGLTEPPTDDFVDRIMTIYADVTNRWPIEFTSLTAVAIGFAGLASLGPVLGRLASPADARGGLVMVAFLGLGGIGLASQLIQIGALPFLTSPELCECGLREEEIMAREVVINTIFGVQLWLVVGALVLAAPGIWLAGSLGADAGMPPAWRWLSLLIALAALVLVVLVVLEAFPFDQYLLGSDRRHPRPDLGDLAGDAGTRDLGHGSRGAVAPVPAFATVDEYIASFPPDVRRTLTDVRAAIRTAVPGTEERISYGIPTFALDGRYVVYFSGWKRHISVYPIPDVEGELATRIAPYQSGKGTLKFPLDEPMPLELIKAVAARLLQQRRERS